MLGILFIIWPLGQLLELPQPLSGAHLYALDLTLIIFFLLNINKFKATKRHNLLKKVLFFAAIGASSLFLYSKNLSLPSFIVSLLYLIRWLTYSLSFLVFELVNKKTLHKLLLISFTIFTATGLLQYLFVPDTRFFEFLTLMITTID